MSWDTFKSIYKAEMSSPNGDPAKGLSDGYHTAVMTSLSNTTGPAIGNKGLMFAQLKLCFNSFGIIPFSRGLDLSSRLSLNNLNIRSVLSLSSNPIKTFSAGSKIIEITTPSTHGGIPGQYVTLSNVKSSIDGIEKSGA